MQALVRGRRDCRQVLLAKIDALRAEAAHSIDQQAYLTRATQLGQRGQIVEAPRSRLVVHDGQVAESCIAAGSVEPRRDAGEIRGAHPVTADALVRNTVLRADLRDP